MSGKTKHIALIASLALVLAISVYVTLGYLVAAKRDLAATRAEQRASSGVRQLELDVLKAALEETAEDRARLQEFIVTEEQLTEFLALIEDSARAQGLVATMRSVDILQSEGGFEELRVTLDARGSYEGQRALILLFETMPFHIDMETVALDRGQGGVWQGLFTFRVTKEGTP